MFHLQNTARALLDSDRSVIDFHLSKERAWAWKSNLLNSAASAPSGAAPKASAENIFNAVSSDCPG